MGPRPCMGSMLCWQSKPVSFVSDNSGNNALLQQPAAVFVIPLDLADCHPVVIVLAHSHFCPPRPVCLLSRFDGSGWLSTTWARDRPPCSAAHYIPAS